MGERRCLCATTAKQSGHTAGSRIVYCQKPSSGDCVIALAQRPLRDRVEGRYNRWQHRLNREHPTCTERWNAHIRVRMEGWRQKQLGVQRIAFRSAGDELVPTTEKTG